MVLLKFQIFFLNNKDYLYTIIYGIIACSMISYDMIAYILFQHFKLINLYILRILLLCIFMFLRAFSHLIFTKSLSYKKCIPVYMSVSK